MIAKEQNDSKQMNEIQDELREICRACGIESVHEITQVIKKVSSSSYIGKGKVSEIKEYIDDNEINLVVFNTSLTPIQLRNLEVALNCTVLDKIMLILEIFSNRAQTPESKAQVEIANLKYLMPRIIGSREDLGRQVAGGNRNRGLGETKLELDRRELEKRIQSLEKNLKEYKKHRSTQKTKRLEGDIPLVALVGYTNAGKSSLMNYFVSDQEKTVFVEDMLFASLETTTRHVSLDPQISILLTDTVGFIQDLPKSLLRAFHSTLDELKDADLIIHVIDRSNVHYERHKEVIENTLKELEIHETPVLNVYNKIDKLEHRPLTNGKNSLFVSIKTSEGMELLRASILEALQKDYTVLKLFIPYSDINKLDGISKQGIVLDQSFEDEGALLQIKVHKDSVSRLQDYLVIE